MTIQPSNTPPRELPLSSRSLRAPFDADPFKRISELIGRRWTLQIFAELADGPLRRSHLRFRLRGISDKVLTETLRDLEASDLVSRTFYEGTPPRVDYALTGQGRHLTHRLASLAAWVLRDVPVETWRVPKAAKSQQVSERGS